jgi:hypothetical protein
MTVSVKNGDLKTIVLKSNVQICTRTCRILLNTLACRRIYDNVLYHLSVVSGVREEQMANNEKTGKKAGTAASNVLKKGSSSKDDKTSAGSALSQRPDKKK